MHRVVNCYITEKCHTTTAAAAFTLTSLSFVTPAYSKGELCGIVAARIYRLDVLPVAEPTASLH